MIIFVYGEDGYRAQEKVRVMREAFVKKFDPTGLNLSMFPSGDTQELDPGAVLQAARSLPFLSSRRFVVVRDLLDSVRKENQVLWEEGLAQIPDSTIFVCVDSLEVKAAEKHRLFKHVKEHGKDVHAYPFPEFSPGEVSRWAAARVSEQGGSIAPDALRLLVERVGTDTWQLSQEISKLTAFAQKQPITTAMVQTMVAPSFEGEIFALMDAVGQKRTGEALKKLQVERAAGANDMYLFTMLTRQVRLLLGARSLLEINPRVSSQEVAQEIGVHPFVAGKVLGQARAYTTDVLREAHQALFHFDAAMKSGQASAEEGVDIVTTQLLQ